MNLLNVTKTFATEDQALDYLVKSRWPNRELTQKKPLTYKTLTREIF